MSFEEPANLEFRRRPESRPRRMQPFSSQSIWLAIALIAAIVFVLFVRAMLERSAWTAGRSTDVVSSAPHVPSDAELKAQPRPQSVEPEAAGTRESVASRPVPGEAFVYRCVGKDRVVSFQSQPCGDDQSTTRILDATPEYERPRRATSNVSAARPPTQQYSYTTINNDARDQRRANCENARRQRDATLKQVGLARTYDLLQRLDAMVYEACKGL